MSDKHISSKTDPNHDKSTPPNSPSKYFTTEQDVLAYWKDNKIFEKSVSSRAADKQWNFLDGPPFVTGMPHYGHILGSILKDVFPRFKTMQGYAVRRVWGWDCHGLPAENKVENALGLKSKKEIEEKVGVKKFIDECKKYVNDVSSEWEWYVDHIGRWVDFKNAYRTMDTNYMESVMWVFKQMYDKGHIYKGLRVSLYCPHCSTPISNFEVAMDPTENYKEVVEPSNTYKYKVKDTHTSLPTYFLAWSTTPWTKLSTTALAVNPDLIYVTVEHGGQRYILAKSTLENTFQSIGVNHLKIKIIESKTGSELVGVAYEPHFDFYKLDETKKSHLIVADGFVTADEGTGIVTLAPYGEDDLKVMTRDNIQIVLNIDDEGHLTEDNSEELSGMYYLKANKIINQQLSQRGLIFEENPKHAHTVAFCWRCHERLIYKPQEAWYVNVQDLKPTMTKTNEDVNWYPPHFKEGRFQKSMEGAPDWCISRSRYWGSPVPVWECECGERFVPGSIAELENASGQTITDLHKPGIDEVFVKCAKCNKKAKRVPEVLDSWIEAGSASFAERHFPFENSENLKTFFPPDFISEYTGQIRAWFYVLHVISSAIYGQPAFKNVLVSGVILGTDGRKMSKNYKNYPDPREVMEKYGGDALRLYLLGSPITKAEDIKISEVEYRDQLRLFIIPLLNIWNFVEMYAEVDSYDVRVSHRERESHKSDEQNVLDKWLISKVNSLVTTVTSSLESYDTVSSVKQVTAFVDEWSRWYIRRSRDRIGTGELTKDSISFYGTNLHVFDIFLRLIAPIVPFHSEFLFGKMSEGESIHLTTWPKSDDSLIHNELEKNMELARKICEAGHQVRKLNNQKVRNPLAIVSIQLDGDFTKIQDNTWEVVLSELNVKNIIVNNETRYPKVEVKVTEEELAREGAEREIIREIQALRKASGLNISDSIRISIHRDMETYIPSVQSKLKISEYRVGDELKIL